MASDSVVFRGRLPIPEDRALGTVTAVSVPSALRLKATAAWRLHHSMFKN